MLFYFNDDLNYILETSLSEDIIHSEGKIYVGKTAKDYAFAESINSKAWSKKLKDGTYIYHAFNGKRPNKIGTTNLLRRLFYRICLSSGNPTWDNIEALNEWIEKLDNASCKEDIMDAICKKYCKKCRMNSKNSCSDIGIDAMTLALQGYKH